MATPLLASLREHYLFQVQRVFLSHQFLDSTPSFQAWVMWQV